MVNLIHERIVSVGSTASQRAAGGPGSVLTAEANEEAYVFEEFMGIPAHPLLIHAAVVFVPLLILVGLGYALVPALRKYLWWAALLLAVAAPGAALLAKLSGDAFRARLVRNDMATPEGLAAIDEHRTFGTNLVYAALALGVLLIVLVLLSRSRTPDAPARSSTPVTIALTVAVLAASGAAGYYVFQAGDTGARMVWGTM